ncbi:hypothetical protein [Streptomyces sp. NBC_00366]|uniref:hypothetical protein n=1 Tax=Streptomyces sp. NBC_00366 TaxID=2975727 RepID=UPI002E25B4A3
MFTEQQLNQLRELLAPLQAGQGRLEARMGNLESQFEAHREDSKKEHEDIGGLISGLSEHTDTVVEAAQKKTVEVLTNRMKVTFEHQDKRITRLEKHAGLAPLE